MSIVFNPPPSCFVSKCLVLFSPVFVRNKCIKVFFSVWLIVTFWGFGREESANISFGRANIFITVIFPVNVNSYAAIVSGQFRIVLFLNPD